MSFFQCVSNKSEVHSPAYSKSANTYQQISREVSSGLQANGGMPHVDVLDTMVQFHPDPSHYNLITVIGNGCNGAATISLAKHIPSGTLVSVKRINLDICQLDLATLHTMVRMHKQMNHPNILSFLCSFVHKNEIWLVLPLMAYGSCRDLIHAHFTEGLPELAVAYILRDVLQGLEYIHQRHHVHRGIRASHILISASGQTCLTGLRHSFSMFINGRRQQNVHNFPQEYCAELLWASPELLEQNLAGYNTKSDIYSIGITACELANGVPPFTSMPLTQMLLEKLDGVTPQLLDAGTVEAPRFDDRGDRWSSDEESPDTDSVGHSKLCQGTPILGAYLPQDTTLETAGVQTDSGIGDSVGTGQSNGPMLPTHSVYTQRTFSAHFHHFVQLCLQPNPQLRPTAATLLQHSFIRQIKRKSAIECLPELLQPVSPISDNLPSLPPDDASVDELQDGLKAIDLTEPVEWNFE